ncbi:MAG TPA: DAK2 domain-containing protein [Halanaerobiales bacterium]|nr:DAK2 domain-containing protein [Halanaerobiales bacterium]
MSINKETYEPANRIDGKEFKKMLYSSLKLLKKNQSYIDSLNVFPVPDGDTGTNMYLTYKEAIEEVKNLNSDRVDEITSALAQGALMGARGNSGVILSQLLRGFSQANERVKNLNTKNLAAGIENASKIAYQGVLKPVEGTILTVSRKAGEEAQSSYEDGYDILGILENTYEAAEKALEKTPEQLPKLKEAGVVDAGGVGFVTILKAVYKELKGDLSFSHETELEVVETEEKEVSTEKLEYTYCTQTLIYTKEEVDTINIEKIREELQEYGDSLMVVGSGNIIKIHIHSNNPGRILEYALNFGDIGDISIDNMERQKEHKESAEVAKNLNENKTSETKVSEEKKLTKVDKDIGIISVAKGNGMKNIMKDLGVDIIISGGQSMNPSTNDFVEAIKQLDVDKIIILPNNKNIISAAKQSMHLTDKELAVIETKSIPEAISSLLVFNDQAELSDLKEAMEGETDYVKTAEITTAVKDSQLKGFKIKEGDIIGILDGEIEVHGENYEEVVLKLFEKKLDDEDLITIYYGEDVTEEEAEDLKNQLKEKFNLDEIEIYNGGQPLYPYIISLE